jgi:anti-sigma B factor antagonist
VEGLADEGTAQVSASVVDPEHPVFSIEGELDIASVGAIQQGMEPYLSGPPDRVVFDLGKLEFMDSSGIALLVQVANRVGRVEIRNATPIVRRVLEVTGLVGAFGMDE